MGSSEADRCSYRLCLLILLFRELLSSLLCEIRGSKGPHFNTSTKLWLLFLTSSASAVSCCCSGKKIIPGCVITWLYPSLESLKIRTKQYLILCQNSEQGPISKTFSESRSIYCVQTPRTPINLVPQTSATSTDEHSKPTHKDLFSALNQMLNFLC